jgi:hypothetical protein
LALKGRAQSPPAEAQPQDHFFAGTITALASDKITVSRTVLGSKPDTRTFLIKPETRIEGKPRLKARVTVRWVPDEEGDRAVHIIVRSTQKAR